MNKRICNTYAVPVAIFQVARFNLSFLSAVILILTLYFRHFVTSVMRRQSGFLG